MGAQTINFETEGVKREYGRTVVFNFQFCNLREETGKLFSITKSTMNAV